MIEFLGFFSTLKQLLSGNVDIVIFTILRSIFYMLCTLIYRMISYVYDIFIALCNGQLLDSDTLNTLFGRFGMLLGVIMMFRVAFSFIQVLINPDSFSDNQKGIHKIVTKVIIAIIMFGLSSYVFDFLRDVQGEIIESNVIPKFLLPVEVNTKDFGSTLSAEFFTAFYNLNPDLDYTTSDPCAQQDYIDGLKGEIQKNNNFSYNRAQCLNATGTIKQTGDEEFFIEFNFIFALLAGIAILYFLFSYCISVGTRIIQLAVLQIIAPMAIVGYLSPKQDNLFTKWYKLYFATYIDVFIRIAIINFIVYLCGLILEGWNSGNSVFWSSVGMPSGFTKTLIGIMMIMALLSFAKKAPELIKNLFPASASGLSLGVDKDNKPMINTALGLGAAAGALGFYTARNVGGRTVDGIRNNGLSYFTKPLENRATALNQGFTKFKNANTPKEKAKVLGSGALAFGRGTLNLGGKGVGMARSGLSTLYSGGKIGYGSKNPFSSLKEGYSVASGSTVTTKNLSYLDYLDDTIDKVKDVKLAKEHYNQMIKQYGNGSGQATAAKAALDAARNDAWDNDAVVAAARKNVESKTGYKLNTRDDLGNAQSAERTKEARHHKIK